MKMRRIVLILILVVQAASFVFSQSTDQDLAPYVAFVEKQMKRDRIPALSIGFYRYGKDGVSTWVHGFGTADLENNVSAGADSAYRLGSLSKMQTAAAVLQLAEKGKINLDAEIQTYVPYFPKKKWPVTVRQVLGHLGGISHYKDYAVEGRIKEHKSTREAIAIFQEFDLVAEPGTKFVYSTYGYNLLAAIVEGASGMPFGDYMRENIWGPLGMTQTRMDDPTDLIPHRVRGYRLIAGEIKNSEFVDVSSRLGGGGERSTVPDLLKFARGMNDARIFSPESRDLMFTSMSTKDGHWTEYGMGWDVESLHGRVFYSHTGSQQETRTVLYDFPTRGLIIAAADNQEDVSPGFYVRSLYQYLEQEPFTSDLYTGDEKSDVKIKALQTTFEAGLSYFDLHGRPMTEDPSRLNSAFAYLNQLFNEKNPKASAQIKESIHPASGEPLRVAGSFIAARLAKAGHDPLSKYPRLGAIPFFRDYVELCSSDKTIGRSWRLDRVFEKQLITWNDQWMHVQSHGLEHVWITADSDFHNLETILQSAFAGSPVLPDYGRDFNDAILDLIASNEIDHAMEASALETRLYPKSDRAAAWRGIAALAARESTTAGESLQRSAQLNPKGEASADSLNDTAYVLSLYGKLDVAADVLSAAATLHPDDPGIYESMGELYLLRKEKDKAIDAFRKALQLSPDNDGIKKRLATIQ